MPHTTAGQILVMAISLRPCRTKSIARPLVRTLMATLPVVNIRSDYISPHKIT